MGRQAALPFIRKVLYVRQEIPLQSDYLQAERILFHKEREEESIHSLYAQATQDMDIIHFFLTNV